MGGHVPLLMGAFPACFPHIKSGKMRALGVTSIKRSPAIPEVPTIAEQGVPGYDVKQWFGIACTSENGSRSASNGCTTNWQRCFRCLTWRRHSNSAGADPVTNTPREFDAYLRAEIARWTKVVNAAGVKAE